MTTRIDREIRYVGAPTITESGREVLAFHFHRYLSGWMARRGHGECWISIGFEGTSVEEVTFRLTPKKATPIEVAWTFDDLCSTYRHGDNRLILEQGREAPSSLEAIPLFDEGTGDGLGVLIGFAIFDESSELSHTEVSEVQAHALEALRTARRNSVRLFFDDHDDAEMKPFFYSLLNRLPEWCGCDGSAAILLADSVETVALSAGPSSFHVMAERLFGTEDRSTERLVGMPIEVDDEEDDIVADAVRGQRDDPAARVHVFEHGRVAGVDSWGRPDSTRQLRRYHALGGRDPEATFLLVPLTGGDETGLELLGFLSLTFTNLAPLGSSTLEVFDAIARHLSQRLAHSPLYTLSAKKVVLLRDVTTACEESLAGDHTAIVRLEELIGRVTRLIAEHADVPSASIGYIKGEPGERSLCYRHPFGWTDLEQIDLSVDIEPGEHADSGVTSLAVRLGQTVVLAGGRPDDSEFKNHLWVHEGHGELVDARRPEQADRIGSESGWYPLKEVYKPARHGAYATLAFPIQFAGKPLGVLAVEVDRDTSWTWWTGHGGRLVWELLSDQLAVPFWLLCQN